MPYTTYLFDFDYTLADSSRGIVHCFHHVLDAHGYTDVKDEAIKRTIGKTLEESFTLLTGIDDPAQLAQMKAEYTQEAGQCMTANTFLFPETKQVLHSLKANGARIGILSTKYRFRIEELTRREFPEGFFDIIIGGEDVQRMKPDPEGLRLAIERLQCTPEKTLYIGDSTVDAETAQAAGVRFVGILHGVTTREELERYPHLAIHATLEGLTKKAHPIPTPRNRHRREPKKPVSITQILLLLLIGYFAWEECDRTFFSDFEGFFPYLFLISLWLIARRRRFLPLRWHYKIEERMIPLRRRIRIIQVRLVRGKTILPMTTTRCTCLSCGEHYTGNFCPRCGQSRKTARYHLSNALKNIAGGFFNIDSGFGRTFADLLYRPGHLMREFIQGKRSPYFRPFQMLFILAALYIMMVQLVDPEALAGEKVRTEQKVEPLQQLESKLKIDMEQTQDSIEKIAIGKIISKIERKQKTPVQQELDEDYEEFDFLHFRKTLNAIKEFIREKPFLNRVCTMVEGWLHGNKAFVILTTLPLFAIGSYLTSRNRRLKQHFNLTEHLFIQSYIACQMLILSMAVLLIQGEANINDLYELSPTGIFIVFWIDHKQIYYLTWRQSFWFTLRMFLYSLTIVFILAIIAVTILETLSYFL